MEKGQNAFLKLQRDCGRTLHTQSKNRGARAVSYGCAEIAQNATKATTKHFVPSPLVRQWSLNNRKINGCSVRRH